MSKPVDYFQYSTYLKSTKYISDKLPVPLKTIHVGIVCGSGLGGLADALTDTVEFEYKDIPDFPLSTVEGHKGKLVIGFLNGKVTCCMVGRFHFYEGHSLMRTVFPIRVMKILGARILIVTNAAGALNPEFRVGDIMVINDHVSVPGLAGQNALIGANIKEFGTRFPAVSDAYDLDLRKLAFQSAHQANIEFSTMREGVYCFVAGPSFETRAECRFLRQAGGDCVGMSTIPEVIVARHCGMKVLGLSLITNQVASGLGVSARSWFESMNGSVKKPASKKSKLVDSVENIANHEEVLAASANRSVDMLNLVSKIVSSI